MQPNLTNKPPVLDKKNIKEAIKEAEKKKLDFNPKARATFIREKVGILEILRQKGLTEPELKEHPQLKDFVEKYPELFKKIVSGEDVSMLRGMLEMLDKMAIGSLTHHNASVIVGKELATRYINNTINSLAQQHSDNQEQTATEEQKDEILE
jgi:hypothetical protein